MYELGHITKMAATPIYGKKTLQKSSQEPVDYFYGKVKLRNMLLQFCFCFALRYGNEDI